MPSEQLLEEAVYNDKGYDEVDLYREYHKKDDEVGQLVPDTIVCFNEVDEASIAEARRISEQFGLEKPLKIRVIHEECYQEKIDEFKAEVAEKYKQKEKTVVSDKTKEMIAQMSEGASQTVIVDMINVMMAEMKARVM